MAMYETDRSQSFLNDIHGIASGFQGLMQKGANFVKQGAGGGSNQLNN